MFLSYFDENKFTSEQPFFYIGGIMVHDAQLSAVEDTLSLIVSNFFGSGLLNKETEIHGKMLWHGKGPFGKRKAVDRIRLISDLFSVILDHQLPVRLVRIDVFAHHKKHRYPMPEYPLALMLFLERICDVLEQRKDVGLVFGDHEEDEFSRAIGDFSSFKLAGRTPMYRGRPLTALKDTIYYTRSHHSRFLQVADLVVFMAQRFDLVPKMPEKWHEAKGWEQWQLLKEKSDYALQHWPFETERPAPSRGDSLIGTSTTGRNSTTLS